VGVSRVWYEFKGWGLGVEVLGFRVKGLGFTRYSADSGWY
jgi:hypothetical protein